MKIIRNLTTGDFWLEADCTPLIAAASHDADPHRAVLAYITTDGDAATADDEVEVVTVYRVNDTLHDNIDDASAALSGMFDEMCAELRADYGNDTIARNEDFNNWTDTLCKDGEICDDTYNECTYT